MPECKVLQKWDDGMDMITEASLYLFNATRGRVYFRSVKVLIPPTWKDKSYEKPKHETYEKADVIVANPYWNYGDDPYTLQHEACGKMGKYIHFTPNFLVNDYLTDIYGSWGRAFMHEWAHL
ncbi:calcium-activated chloride channel regulator family member 3-like isoform X2 [Anas platyrhynchos]|uniref:calcium-activated chloride channel regulator family member 3-like isoform X2 n=1 Tax=Anas platyrhynchos TaxID=8839 RepID=UPI003AF2068B